MAMAGNGFGSQLPLSEPSWYTNFNTPYYNQSHVAWRARLRAFVDKEVMPLVGKWDKAAVQDDHETCKKLLAGIYAKTSVAGILPAVVGKPWPSKYTKVPSPENYDYFHELINVDEITRAGGGIGWTLIGGIGIGLPPLLNFGMPGNPALAEQVIQECLAGTKIICLCITEPGAGSDVAAIQCTAEDKGDHYLVTGNKKWITNGIFADYFTVAVRTGAPGHAGLSMLLLDKSMPGISVQKMDCMGVWPSGTTYIDFDEVKVPKTNLIGKLNEGFKQVMFNFNHERWVIATQATRLARTCVEESIAFARERETFGKKLIEHQVIQHRIGEMARQVEGLQAYLEYITFQMNTMSKNEQNQKLGGHIALLKVQASRTAEYCANAAIQVFGGAGYTRSGKGAKIERIYREVKSLAIPGGSEEIMLNLAAGQFRFVDKPTKDPRDAKIAALQAEVKALKAKL